MGFNSGSPPPFHTARRGFRLQRSPNYASVMTSSLVPPPSVRGGIWTTRLTVTFSGLSGQLAGVDRERSTGHFPKPRIAEGFPAELLIKKF